MRKRDVVAAYGDGTACRGAEGLVGCSVQRCTHESVGGSWDDESASTAQWGREAVQRHARPDVRRASADGKRCTGIEIDPCEAQTHELVRCTTQSFTHECVGGAPALSASCRASGRRGTQ
jgi:hypothetical protein